MLASKLFSVCFKYFAITNKNYISPISYSSYNSTYKGMALHPSYAWGHSSWSGERPKWVGVGQALRRDPHHSKELLSKVTELDLPPDLPLWPWLCSWSALTSTLVPCSPLLDQGTSCGWPWPGPIEATSLCPPRAELGWHSTSSRHLCLACLLWH